MRDFLNYADSIDIKFLSGSIKFNKSEMFPIKNKETIT